MKLSILKVANAVPCGPKTETVFQSTEYDITEYDNFKLRIVHRSTKVMAHTSLFNSVYWKYLEEPNGPDSNGQPGKRGPKPKEG